MFFSRAQYGPSSQQLAQANQVQQPPMQQPPAQQLNQNAMPAIRPGYGQGPLPGQGAFPGQPMPGRLSNAMPAQGGQLTPSIYGQMGSPFNADALRQMLTQQYGGQSRPLGQATFSGYGQSVSSALNDFRKMLGNGMNMKPANPNPIRY